MTNSKYFLECKKCNHTVENFSNWFEFNQRCPECKSNQVKVTYKNGYDNLLKLTSTDQNPSSIWHYFDYLPLHEKSSIVSFNEGTVPIQRWNFLEKFAKENFGINCEVHIHRYDLNPATGTFKDLAGSVVSSVLNENGKKNYVVASTGNIANAYAHYLAAVGITVKAFIPHNSSVYMEAGIASYGQKVYRVNGDYDKAKNVAADFAKLNNYLIAAGNFDPMRIEAKKTMVYEWMRQIKTFPTVYIQALSGGTGPLGIQKALTEMEEAGQKGALPRQLMVQSNKCDPMAQAWKKARDRNFPKDWEMDYPILKNPQTLIPTLSTGNPKTYPVLAKFVKQSGGEIISCDEEKTVDIARFVAAEVSVLAGPAATISIAGFMQALKDKYIHNGDIVMINLGEGINRSSDFVEMLNEPAETVDRASDCSPFDQKKYKEKIRDKVYNLFS